MMIMFLILVLIQIQVPPVSQYNLRTTGDNNFPEFLDVVIIVYSRFIPQVHNL